MENRWKWFNIIVGFEDEIIVNFKVIWKIYELVKELNL